MSKNSDDFRSGQKLYDKFVKRSVPIIVQEISKIQLPNGREVRNMEAESWRNLGLALNELGRTDTEEIGHSLVRRLGEKIKAPEM